MPFPNIDPVAFMIGPVAIRWYALAYIAGLFLGVAYAARLAGNPALWDKNQPRANKEQIQDLLFWVMLGIILGGRLGFVLFYNPEFYWANPLRIFAVWQGGMSFHGGAAGVAAALFVYARRYRLSFFTLADLASAVAPFGLFFGRLANFINGELWGRPTDLPWGMVFPGAGNLPRHPSQLYEAALEGVLLFLILRAATHRRQTLRRPGLTFAIALAGYGTLRFAVEFVREPEITLGDTFLTMGMTLSLPLILAGLALFVYARRRSPQRQ